MALRPLRTPIDHRSLGHIRLWRNDLETMVNVIREHVTNVRLVADGFELDNVSDLTQLAVQRVHRFTLQSERIKLELGSSGAVLETTDSGLATRAVAIEIERIARSRRRIRLYPNGSDDEPIVPLTLLMAFPVTAGVVAITGPLELGGLMILAAAVVGLLVVTSLFAARLGSSAVMYTKTRAEAPPWIERNRDSLITNAVVSAFFLLVGIVVGYLLPR